MKTENFEQIIGETLDPELTVSNILRTEANRVIFGAHMPSRSAESGDVCLIVDTSDDAAENFKRFLEARFLDHSNLAQPFLVDWVELDGRRCPCMGLDSPDAVLGEMLKQQPLSNHDLLELAKEILSAFVYLHGENLVYGALSLSSVWRVGNRWKLADFSQLRVPGVRPASETRRLLTNREIAAPPEVFHGHVGPGWDIWSLGALISKIAFPVRRPGANQSIVQNSEPIPPVLERFLAACSIPDPSDRMSAEELLQMLDDALVPNEAPDLRKAEEIRAVPAPEPPPPVRRVLPMPPSRSHTDDRNSPRSGFWIKILILALIAGAVFTISLFLTRKIGIRPVASTPPNPVAATASPVAPLPVEPVSEAKSEITSLLTKWGDAKKSGDIAAQLACYAPVVDTYFARHHVAAEQLRQLKQASASKDGGLSRFDILGLTFNDLRSDWAVVSFQKRWLTGGNNPVSGIADEQLILRRYASGWKITNERNS